MIWYERYVNSSRCAVKLSHLLFVFTSNIDGYCNELGSTVFFSVPVMAAQTYLQCIDLCKRRAKNEVYHIDEFNKKRGKRTQESHSFIALLDETSSSRRKIYVS